MREIVSAPPARDDTAERQAALAVADELVRLTTVLSDLAYDLGCDPQTLRKHMGSLQSIDLITQIQLALADFLRSAEPLDRRISGVSVEALAGRLQAKLGALASSFPDRISAAG